jgi:hypothetical protein
MHASGFRFASVCCLPLLVWVGALAQANPNLPLDRPYSLRNAAPDLLEREYDRMIRADGPASYIFPRPCVSPLDSSRVCGEAHGWTHAGDSRQISLSPQAGYEFRSGDENVSAVEMGALASGGNGPLSLYLDARIITEFHEDFDHASYDHEFVEKQDREASGSVAYSSYSRYRSNLDYDLPWGRFSVARDAVHWGPGLYANLAFNQGALPFNQVSWVAHFGPVSFATLYGRLTIGVDSADGFNRGTDTRSIYAHRYEWRVNADLLLGVSEQLIFFDEEDAFAFVPVVPLFISKGARAERDNNGNIAADVSYRLGRFLRMYSEFLIDDLQSPTSLFDDFWGNKWAWMFGTQAVRDLPLGQGGVVLEYSRVEPWVYTHYLAATAQAANGGLPLGNPQGPNSQWMVLKTYLRGTRGWYASLQSDLLWKGHDRGSALNDDREGVPPLRKIFLDGVTRPTWAVSPLAGYAWKSLYLEAAGELGREPGMRARLAWRY